MGKFFSKFKPAPADPAVSTWSNLSQFYSLLVFLIAVPFVLIVALVWLTGILGFNLYIFAGFAVLCAFAIWRLVRKWSSIKAKMANQASNLHDIMREAAKDGKDVEVSLLNGVVTLRYRGQQGLESLPAAIPPPPLALAAPAHLVTPAEESPPLKPERLREELEEFVRLRDTGVISPEEFDRIKASLLQRMSA
ncbi:MAG: SHOCT domain-containing protein [Syntrophales bacterium]|nr:SHOCT domain-containing protein [Syntrophales bacterium]